MKGFLATPLMGLVYLSSLVLMRAGQQTAVNNGRAAAVHVSTHARTNYTAKSSAPVFDIRQEPTNAPQAGPLQFISLDETNAIDPSWLKPSEHPYTLGPGDVITIEVMGEEGVTTTFVGPDGKIYVHILPGQQVWGLSLPEVEAQLEKELAKYLRRPKVTITLIRAESRRAWVLGRVTRPGVLLLSSPMSLLEAISRVGGTEISGQHGTTLEVADLRHSVFMRRGKRLPVDFARLVYDGDTSQNVYLEPDDFIFVPSSLSSEIIVLGAVRQPKNIPYKDRMPLTAVIAEARGTEPNAYLSHVAIVRGSLSQPKIAIVDFKAIITGRIPDVVLEPRDIVYVPLNPFRSIKRYANLILDMFVRTAAVNAGTKAAGGNPTMNTP
jgi:protein involved in polysaccharide export with SLBB domain